MTGALCNRGSYIERCVREQPATDVRQSLRIFLSVLPEPRDARGAPQPSIAIGSCAVAEVVHRGCALALRLQDAVQG